MKRLIITLSFMIFMISFTACKGNAALQSQAEDVQAGEDAKGRISEPDELLIYSDILRHPERYEEFYALTDNIPSEDMRDRILYYDGTKPYYFEIKDMDGDGTDELLLCYGLQYDSPEILLNILRYDKGRDTIVDVDGERTYPLMDGLVFYASGYYTTQNGIGSLYTECWRLEDRVGHYWSGYERGEDGFEDTDGHMLPLNEYYDMIGEEIISIQWKEVTEENISLLEQGLSVPVAAKGDAGTAEDTAEALDNSGDSWREAYDRYIASCDEREIDYFDFIYIDEDDIPELAIIGKYSVSGCTILTYKDGKVHPTYLTRFEFSYMGGQNLLLNSGGNTGYYYHDIYSILGGKLVRIAKGDYHILYSKETQGERRACV